MTLPWKTRSDRSISIIEDGISGLLHYCCMVCCKEDGCYGKWAFRLDVNKEYHCRNIISKQVNLAYDKFSVEYDDFRQAIQLPYIIFK